MTTVEKILVVDDEIFILEEISEALDDEGYTAICVDNVDSAIDALTKNPEIRLVVTDLKMPHKSGVDLINDVERNFDRPISFIIISGHGSYSDTMDRDVIERFPFLRKPLRIDDMLVEIEKILTDS